MSPLFIHLPRKAIRPTFRRRRLADETELGPISPPARYKRFIVGPNARCYTCSKGTDVPCCYCTSSRSVPIAFQRSTQVSHNAGENTYVDGSTSSGRGRARGAAEQRQRQR